MLSQGYDSTAYEYQAPPVHPIEGNATELQRVDRNA